jgi:hypothetical protein
MKKPIPASVLRAKVFQILLSNGIEYSVLSLKKIPFSKWFKCRTLKNGRRLKINKAFVVMIVPFKDFEEFKEDQEHAKEILGQIQKRIIH